MDSVGRREQGGTLDVAHISQWVSLPGVGGGWLKEETGDRKSDATKKLHDCP